MSIEQLISSLIIDANGIAKVNAKMKENTDMVDDVIASLNTPTEKARVMALQVYVCEITAAKYRKQYEQLGED